MPTIVLILSLFLGCLTIAAAEELSATIDRLAHETRHPSGGALAPPCSDGVFVRRIHLDLIGTLPSANVARAFIDDTSSDKRARLVDELLTREEYALLWSLRWADVLRIKAEFPIKLWPNGAQAYHRLVQQAMADNRPLDDFARELLTASGSAFRVPAVNFYLARPESEDPAAAIAASVAQTLLGQRYEHWGEARQRGFATAFSRVAVKGTAEWKERIVHLDPSQVTAFTTTMPDGSTLHVPTFSDPRPLVADWILSLGADGSPAPFAYALSNRLWAWTLGRGLVDPVDDLGGSSPARSQELLDTLARACHDLHFDQRALLRAIVLSATYQQQSAPMIDDEALHFQPCRLEGEVLTDALRHVLNWQTNDHERLSSEVPEPFTYLPRSQRAIAIADGGISDDMLALFGRASRDTGRSEDRSATVSSAQRLFLLNDKDVLQRINGSRLLQQLLKHGKEHSNRAINLLYLSVLARRPDDSERQRAQQHLAA
ncbi:MAG: DUF1553 domain-containing protein, partial [Planctomycetota bacterium]